MKGAGDLLAVLILVIHNTFESQSGKVFEHEIVILGDAAGGGALVRRRKFKSRLFTNNACDCPVHNNSLLNFAHSNAIYLDQLQKTCN